MVLKEIVMKAEDLLKEAKQRAKDEFNNLPFEIRKKLANGYDRLLEITALIKVGERLNMAYLRKRKGELEAWLLEWYSEIDKLEVKS